MLNCEHFMCNPPKKKKRNSIIPWLYPNRSNHSMTFHNPVAHGWHMATQKNSLLLWSPVCIEIRVAGPRFKVLKGERIWAGTGLKIKCLWHATSGCPNDRSSRPYPNLAKALKGLASELVGTVKAPLNN